MKKITLLAVFLSMLCAWPTTASAQGIEKATKWFPSFWAAPPR